VLLHFEDELALGRFHVERFINFRQFPFGKFYVNDDAPDGGDF